MEKYNVKTIVEDNKLIFKRYFDSPKELVFEAWSSPEHLGKWWGPDGFTLTTHSMDFSNGGTWDFTMHGPDGRNYKNKIQFIEINKPHSIVYKQLGEEEDAEGVRFQTKVFFKEVRGGINLVIEMEFPSKKELERVERKYRSIEGAEQHIKRLGEYVASLRKEK